MTKTLFLLRHAKASAEPAASDFERTLAPRGVSDAVALGKQLQADDVHCTLALVSAAKRTQATLSCLQDNWRGAAQLQMDEALYLASAGDMLHCIQQCDDAADSLMIVGHNPGMHQLALMLAEPSASRAYSELELAFPTCALAQLCFDTEQWAQLGTQSAQLAQLHIPRLGMLR